MNRCLREEKLTMSAYDNCFYVEVPKNSRLVVKAPDGFGLFTFGGDHDSDPFFQIEYYCEPIASAPQPAAPPSEPQEAAALLARGGAVEATLSEGLANGQRRYDELGGDWSLVSEWGRTEFDSLG